MRSIYCLELGGVGCLGVSNEVVSGTMVLSLWGIPGTRSLEMQVANYSMLVSTGVNYGQAIWSQSSAYLRTSHAGGNGHEHEHPPLHAITPSNHDSRSPNLNTTTPGQASNS